MLQEYDNVPNNEDLLFPWHILGKEMTKDSIWLEPGERQLITHDFIIPSGVHAVAASVWGLNEREEDIGLYEREIHVMERR